VAAAPKPAAPAAPRPMAQPSMGTPTPPRPAAPTGGGGMAQRPAGTATPTPSSGGGVPGSSSSPSAQPYRPSWAKDDDDM
jgi:hypothetical protein